MLIRDANLSDIDRITEIYSESVDNGVATYELTPPDLEEMTSRFRAMTGKGYPYLVAEQDDAILGYAYAGPFRQRPAYRWSVEDSIYLSPDARGHGIGSQLLNELIARTTALGFRQMVAVIGGASSASVNLHEKAGFEHVGVMKATGFKHGQWLDTILMQLSLGDADRHMPDLDQYPGTLYSEN